MTPPHPASRPIGPAGQRPDPGGVLLPLLGLLTLLPVVFWRGSAGPFEVTKLALLQVAAIAIVVLWRGPGFARLNCPVVVAVLLGCASAAISAVGPISPRTSWQGAW